MSFLRMRFLGGPYDGMLLNLPELIPYIHLGVRCEPTLGGGEQIENGFYCNAVYELTAAGGNSYYKYLRLIP